MNSEVATYGSQRITPEMGVAGAVLITIGLCLFLLGLRIPKLTAGLLTWIGLINQRPDGGYNNHDTVTMITVPASIGVLGAVACIANEQVATYLLGASGGLALALYILCWRADLVIVHPVGRSCFVASLPIAITVAIGLAEFYVRLFSTSMSGAYAFIAGVDFLAHTGYLAGAKAILDGKHRATYVLNPRIYALLSVTGAICLIAMGWQFLSNREGSAVADEKAGDEETAAGAPPSSPPPPS